MPPSTSALFPFAITTDELNEAEIASLQDYRRQISEAVASFEETKRGLEASNEWTATGRANRIGESGRLAAGKLQAISAQLDKISGRLAEESAAMLEAASALPKDGAVAEARQAEIRRHLADRSNIEVGGVLLEAAEAGDVETFAAIIGAPRIVLRGFAIPDGLMAEARELFAERRQPARAKVLRELRAMQRQLAEDLTAGFTALIRGGGIKADDPLLRIAADGQAETQATEDAAAAIRREISRALG